LLVWQECGKTISMDANFGLVRKKSAGKSLAEPNCGSQYFVQDDIVAAFVESYSDKSAKNEVSSR